MKTALIPGSFDPITVGHIDIVKRTAEIFDRVVVAVMINENKKYMFTMDERKRIAELSLSSLTNVEVIASSDWLYKLFDEVGADVIVKGLRNADDLEYENKMAAFNADKNPRAHTLYLSASHDMEEVSSTAFRFLCENEGATDKYIAPEAREYVKKLLAAK